MPAGRTTRTRSGWRRPTSIDWYERPTVAFDSESSVHGRWCDLLEIVDDRYHKGSLLITSQVPVSRWHKIIGDMTLGDAILDRVVHRAHRLELKGASLRKRRSTPDTLTANASE